MKDIHIVKANPPRDKYNLAYAFLFFHGLGFLLPWNVFINAREYFIDYKLNTTLSANADYRINFVNYVGIAAQFPGLCFAAWNTFYHAGSSLFYSFYPFLGSEIAVFWGAFVSSASNPTFRFVVAMVFEVLVLLFTVVIAIIDTSEVAESFNMNCLSWFFMYLVKLTCLIITIVRAPLAIRYSGLEQAIK
ncbi:unnamed protein product [Protopolystoma xenopodis]|uniref:Uncharacterized protein n=1 Tax=Protopolystoma xenopodis TaxID=117903 RepID=A0A3S5AL01_9PLAT|nr:unnamed protein product [Protopolystoma xenopodis]